MEEQRSQEWFTARLGKATSSRFNDIMSKTKSGYGAGRKNYMAELVIERITGEKQTSFTSTPMQWGIDNEPIAKLAYEAETGETVTDAPFVQHDLLEAGASPDGYINDDGVLEIKCPNSATHIQTLQSGKIPFQYYAQVQGQMWVTGRKYAKFMSFDPRMPINAQLIIIDVPRDEAYIEKLEKEVMLFLEEVEAQTEFIKLYGANL
jgi:putative phage-type endonuclease